MPRGGKRVGAPGTAYPNRSDLNVVKKLPIQSSTGGPYGQAKAQQDAQRAVPVGPPAGAGTPVPRVLPGASPFDRPTDMPDQPVTHGADAGPGPGMEALNLPGSERDEDLAALAPYLPTLELLASLPDATASTRNFVRRLRGAVG